MGGAVTAGVASVATEAEGEETAGTGEIGVTGGTGGTEEAVAGASFRSLSALVVADPIVAVLGVITGTGLEFWVVLVVAACFGGAKEGALLVVFGDGALAEGVTGLARFTAWALFFEDFCGVGLYLGVSNTGGMERALPWGEP